MHPQVIQGASHLPGPACCSWKPLPPAPSSPAPPPAVWAFKVGRLWGAPQRYLIRSLWPQFSSRCKVLEPATFIRYLPRFTWPLAGSCGGWSPFQSGSELVPSLEVYTWLQENMCPSLACGIDAPHSPPRPLPSPPTRLSASSSLDVSGSKPGSGPCCLPHPPTHYRDFQVDQLKLPSPE